MKHILILGVTSIALNASAMQSDFQKNSSLKEKINSTIAKDHSGKSFKLNDKKKTFVFALGTEGVGGGDDVGLNFKKTILSVIEKSKKITPTLAAEIEKLQLDELAEQVQVIVTDNEIPVKTADLIQNSVAYNNPSKNIIMINRSRWENIKDESIKEGIALHEYSSIRGVERTGFYPLSAKYVSLVGGNQLLLISQLSVDRLKQVMAEMEDAPKAFILQKLYQTALPATIEDIPFLSDAMTTWGGCVAYNGDFVKSPSVSLFIAKYYSKVVSQQQVNSDDGPIFDNKAENQKLVVENLSKEFVQGMVGQFKKDNYYPNLEVFQKSSLKTTYGEGPNGTFPAYLSSYVETSSYTSWLDVKKDDKYIYFESKGVQKGQLGLPMTFYGYCWKNN